MDHGTAAATTFYQVNNNRVRDVTSNIKASLFIIFLMTHSPLPIYAQSSFSPFSFLGSLFNPASSPNPNWHRPRKVHPRKPQPPPQQIFFKPNLLTSQKFSSSQALKKILRFPGRKNKTPLPIQNGLPKSVKEGKSPQQQHQVIRIISPSNYSLSTSKSIAVTTAISSSQSPLVTSSAWSEQVTETIKENHDLFTTIPSNTDNNEVTIDESHTTLQPDEVTELNQIEREPETVHIIYPTILKETIKEEEVKNKSEQSAKLVKPPHNVSLYDKESSLGLYSSLDSAVSVTKVTQFEENTEQSSIKLVNIPNDLSFNDTKPSIGHFSSLEFSVSGPNPGDNLIGLSKEEPSNYYNQVFQSASLVSSANPYYAPEEFNYNQDPIVLNKSDKKDIETLPIPQEFIIKPRGRTYKEFPQDITILPIKAALSETSVKNSSLPPANATLSSLQDEFVTDVSNARSKTPKSVDFDKLLIPQRLYDQHLKSHPNEIIKLVNTIEYGAPNFERTDESSSQGLIRDIHYSSTEKNLTSSLTSLVDCGAGREVGFCSMTSSYPKEKVQAIINDCNEILEAFKAVIPDDLDELGDNSPSVISSEKDLTRPWSWKVYAYKKRQVCDSELYFIQPAFARDTKGEWRIILQTESINQRVGIDMCHQQNAPCPGMPDCGKKSRCVQRYNYQFLLSLPSSHRPPKTSHCPSIRAFKFPSGCVCHAETSSEQNLVIDKHSHLTF